MNRILVIIFSVLLLYLPDLKANDKYNGKVMDSKSYEPIAGAVVKLSGTGVWTVSKSDGVFELPKSKTTSDSVMLEISCLGYKKSKFKLRKDGIYVLTPKAFAINEVVVTATESKGLTSVSRIGEDAISHIQPSGFADLLELLPGGRSIDPNFGRPQTINLRSAGGYSSTSALGTKFILDGASIENDANMQYTPSYSMMGSTYVNNGMDMRTLTTEDIEYVDVIRGIPSVTYGDLTSGVINIKRRSGGNDLRARFKADMTSKLLYMAKDFETKSKNKFTSNLSLNIFDSRVDPRNLRRNDTGLGSVPFARHYSEHRFFFLFLQVLRCFSSLRLPHLAVLTSLQLAGLSHSDMCGSFPVGRSPHLFATFYVLLRLMKPRHPPFALLLFLS